MMLPSVERKITLGALLNGGLIVAGFIWTASAFASKTTSDSGIEKQLAADLRIRIETLDSRTATVDSRTTVLETSIIYIRESLARIELNTKKP